MNGIAGRLGALVETSWEGATAGQRLVSAALRPASLAYGAVVAVRNRLYDLGALRSERVPARVVGVGNLTVGGSGKTPTALWLAEALGARGRRVAIVSRGYGKTKPGVVIVGVDGRPLVAPSDGGDEAVLAAMRVPVPVITCERRVMAARVACERFACDTIVLDDGFQHRALARDVDIVLVPEGGLPRALLPAGPLREPAASLRRAQAVLALGDERRVPPRPAAPPGIPTFVGRIVPTAAVLLGDGRLVAHDLGILPKRRVVAVAGVARPERFWTLLDRLGVDVAVRLALPDHAPYDAATLAALRAAIGSEGRAVVTTEKDLVKLAGLGGVDALRLCAVRVGVEIEESERLLDLVAPPIEVELHPD
ncbi:MAG TPA: tetraacyldisaccharide 4'-kinase [Candidatus Eisenbacteria bacterium]|nr:tetraacyldisaccharide 4'-kinase [Candidatus Eisenbacteria bacterium]